MRIHIHILKWKSLVKYASLVSASALVFLTAGVSAISAYTVDEKKLDAEVAALDKDAGAPRGETIVTERLEKEFNVTEAQITSLRDKKFGFGEIAIVFALASKLSGGITDDNISKIMAMRQGPPVQGWGEIAKTSGIKLGAVVSDVKKVERSSRSEIGREERAEHELSGRRGEERPHGRY